MERSDRKEPRWDLEASARNGNATAIILSDPERQAHFPEKGTRFETFGTAEIVANTLLHGKMNWRIEKLEEQFVVRVWSIMSSPISESRRWMKVRKPQMKRKPHGSQEE